MREAIALCHAANDSKKAGNSGKSGNAVPINGLWAPFPAVSHFLGNRAKEEGRGIDPPLS